MEITTTIGKAIKILEVNAEEDLVYKQSIKAVREAEYRANTDGYLWWKKPTFTEEQIQDRLEYYDTSDYTLTNAIENFKKLDPNMEIKVSNRGRYYEDSYDIDSVIFNSIIGYID